MITLVKHNFKPIMHNAHWYTWNSVQCTLYFFRSMSPIIWVYFVPILMIFELSPMITCVNTILCIIVSCNSQEFGNLCTHIFYWTMLRWFVYYLDGISRPLVVSRGLSSQSQFQDSPCFYSCVAYPLVGLSYHHFGHLWPR